MNGVRLARMGLGLCWLCACASDPEGPASDGDALVSGLTEVTMTVVYQSISPMLTEMSVAEGAEVCLLDSGATEEGGPTGECNTTDALGRVTLNVPADLDIGIIIARDDLYPTLYAMHTRPDPVGAELRVLVRNEVELGMTIADRPQDADKGFIGVGYRGPAGATITVDAPHDVILYVDAGSFEEDVGMAEDASAVIVNVAVTDEVKITITGPPGTSCGAFPGFISDGGTTITTRVVAMAGSILGFQCL